MKLPRGIAFKLAVVFLTLGIVPMATVGTIAYVLAKNSMTETFIESFVERVAKDTAFTLDRSVEAMANGVQVLAVSTSLRQNVYALQVYRPDEAEYRDALASIRDDLNAWVEILGDVDLLAVADPNGRVIITSNTMRPAVLERLARKDPAHPPSPYLWSDAESNPMEDKSVADRPWWSRAANGDLTLIPWGSDSIVQLSYYKHYPFFLDDRIDLPDRDRLKNPEAYSFGFTRGVPYPKGEGPEGDASEQAVLIAYFNWSVVQDILDRLTSEFQQRYRQYSSGYPFLFADDLDTVIAHKDRKLYGTTLVGDHHLKGLHDAMVRAPGRAGLHYYQFRDHAKVAGFAPVKSTGWELGFGIDEEDFYAEVYRLRNLLAICGLISAGVIVVLIAWFSRRITEPLRVLIRQTGEIARGNLDTKVEIQSRDEIGLLGDAFNTMAEDLKASNKKLIQAEKTAAWREMARQVAHEIKNPLTPIKLSVQLVERAYRDQHPDFDKILARSVRNVTEQIESLRRIASDFSAFASFPKRDLKPHSLKRILEDTLALYENREGDDVEVRMETSLDEDVSIVVDKDELARVFLNLFNNAFEAMPEGGTLSVSSYVLERGDGLVVEIRVKDTGRGISQEIADRLFEPYFTTRSGGTGLGLAIAKRIVEGYGGEIRIQSAPGEGTTVIIVLPIHRQDTPDA